MDKKSIKKAGVKPNEGVPLWPNMIEAIEWLLDNNIYTINFECVYSNIHTRPSSLEVTVESEDDDVIYNARMLVKLVLEREMGDMEPLIMHGIIQGTINLDNGIVQYSMSRTMLLAVRNIIVEVGYKIDGHDKIEIMENIKEVILDNVNKKNGWEFIDFKYKKDIIASITLVDEIKKEMFRKIQTGIENKNLIFKGYNVSNVSVVYYRVESYWRFTNSKFVKLGITLDFENKVEDFKYGVLFVF